MLCVCVRHRKWALSFFSQSNETPVTSSRSRDTHMRTCTLLLQGEETSQSELREMTSQASLFEISQQEVLAKIKAPQSVV